MAGRLVDRVGAWRVAAAAQVVQAAGAVAYLAAGSAAAVAVAAGLLAAGQQLYYSSLFALIADVSGVGPKDRPFAWPGWCRRHVSAWADWRLAASPGTAVLPT